MLRMTTVAAGLLVLAGALAACGGSDSSAQSGAEAPTNASKDDFCHTMTNLSLKSTPGQIADQLAAVGTPSDIDSSARHGFEVFLEKVRALPKDTKAEDLNKVQSDLSSQDQAAVIAFLTYTQQECASLPTDLPS
jgi:hypothetical protein